MLQRNVMLNDRAHAILAEALELRKPHRVENLNSDGTVRCESKPYEISLIDWQCCRYDFAHNTIQEYVQCGSKHGPMNFAYLALQDSSGAIIPNSLWSQSEIESSEASFAQRADD